MADGRKLPYIIEVIANDDSLRKQMKSWDWDKIIGRKGKSFGDKLIGDAEGAINDLKGLNIDWAQILGAKEIGQLEQAVTRALQSSRKSLESLAVKGDASGIKEITEYVAGLGQELHSLGSSFDAASLARGMGAFMKVLTPLSAKFDALAKEPAKIEAAFDKLFNNGVVGINNMSKSSEKIVNVMTKIESATKRTGGAQTTLNKLTQKFKELQNFKLPDLSSMSLDQLEDKLSDLEERWDSLETRFKGKKASAVFQLEKGKLLKEQLHIYEAINKIEPMYGQGVVSEIEGDIQRVVKLFENTIEKLRSELDSDTFAQAISKQLSDLKVGLSLDEKSKTNFINEINTFIKDVNKSLIEKIKLELDEADFANIIEDKSKRTYGDNPADDDVNTTELIAKTEARLDKVSKSIDKKLSDGPNSILGKTKEWRKNMLNQFKFQSGDFEFKFNDTFTQELQTLFDEYFLKVNIDPNYLADQIKVVLNNSDISLSGGTTNIDANALMSAVMTGIKAAMTGEMPPVTTSSANSNKSEDIPQQTEHIVKETEQVAKHLDLAEDYVKDVVEKIKAVAKYASKDHKGSLAVLDKFKGFGIDLQRVKIAGDVGNDAEIISILENAFLKRDEFGNLTGNVIADELSKFKDASSKTIPEFVASLDEMFYMLQENTQTVEEWTNKRKSKETFDYARDRAKAAVGLRNVRATINKGEIPTLESIEKAIDLMSAIGQDVGELETLKAARETLGEQTDNVAVDEFKNAAQTFYESSTKTFWNLKKIAEESFKGSVFVQGNNKDKPHRVSVNNYKQLANIKDDAVIVDIKVSSSLNNVALGEVKSKNSNRTSSREEQRLMRGQTADYISDEDNPEGVFAKKLKYNKFKPQGTPETPINLDATRKTAEENIVKYDNIANELVQNIATLDKSIEERKAKLHKLTNISEVAGTQSKYEVVTSDVFTTSFDNLHALYRNSQVVNESNLPRDNIPTEISNIINKRNELNKQITETEKSLELIQNLTIEEANSRLKYLKETILSDEDITLYKKFIENPLPKEVLKKSKIPDGLMYSQQEFERIKSASIKNKNDAEILLQSNKIQREAINLYSKFLQNPDGTRNGLTILKDQLVQEKSTTQTNLDSAIIAWAKSEEAKIPEAEKIYKQSVEKLLTKVGSIMKNLYQEMADIENQLSGDLSDDDRTALTIRIQDLIGMFTDAQKQYDALIKQSGVNRRKPLGSDKLKVINSLSQKYPSSVRTELQSAIDDEEFEIMRLLKQKSELQAEQSQAESDKKSSANTIKRIEAEKKYNELREKSLILQGSIVKMEQDGASEQALQSKREELAKINAELSEAKAHVDALGGFYGQQSVEEYSDSDKKAYALKELEKIQDDLITAQSRKTIAKGKIKKQEEDIADLDKWGLSAGVGASELTKAKNKLTDEFMSSDYVKSQVDALKEKAKVSIAEAENKSREIFDAKIASAMKHLNWNPLDQIQVQKFLNTEYGQQLSNDFASEVDVNTTNIWKQYDEYKKDLLSKLKAEFQNSFKTDKSVLSATFKTKDQDGNWIDNVITKDIKNELKSELLHIKEYYEGLLIQALADIDRLKAEKDVAVEYGGISDAELLSEDIVQDQIRKEIELSRWKNKQIVAQEKLNELEAANIDHSDEVYKATKKELKEAEEQVGYYEMLVKNRQRLVQMKYDESQEPKYTDEEKRLHFTNQITTYNQNIEDSLKRQDELKRKIVDATGDEKVQLQRQLSIEEDKVKTWSEKIPKYKAKLSKLEEAKTTSETSGTYAQGSIVGSIVTAIKEGISGANINVNTDDLAKEVTLQAILNLLGGSSQGAELAVKLARIAELEAKGAGEGLGRGKKILDDEHDALYETWNVKPQELKFEDVKRRAIELKQVIDTLCDEGKSDTEEFINAQTELSKLLSGWRNNVRKTEAYGEGDNKDKWVDYLQSNIFSNLDNVIINSISKRDYNSRLKNIGIKPQSEVEPKMESGAVAEEVKENVAKTPAEAVVTPVVETKTQQNVQLQKSSSEASVQSEVTNLKAFKTEVRKLVNQIGKYSKGSAEQKPFQEKLLNLVQSWIKTEKSGMKNKPHTSASIVEYLSSIGITGVNKTGFALTNRQFGKLFPDAQSQSNVTASTQVKGRTATEESELVKLRAEVANIQANEGSSSSGGLIQLIGQLATENTLLQVLNALQSIATQGGGINAPTAAGDLYNQFKALLLGGSIDNHERLAFMNSEAGVISSNVIGTIANISEELIEALRAKYPTAKGFDTQIHTHGNSTDPYFSEEDYKHFTADYESGIKKQVLLTKDNISVLDLTAVKSAEEVKNLMDELIKAGDDAEAIKKVFENNKSGALFETANFNSLNANSLVNMLKTKVDSKQNNSLGGLEEYISKIQKYEETIKNAKTDGYLMDDDINAKKFGDISKEIRDMVASLAQGEPLTDEMVADFEKLYRAASDVGNIVEQTIKQNKKLYAGINEIKAVDRQRDKIIASFGTEDELNENKSSGVSNYIKEYKTLKQMYNDFAKNRTLYETKNQESLKQQAVKVQMIGKKLITAQNQAENLKQLVEQSGMYTDSNYVDRKLGGIQEITPEQVSALSTTMAGYVTQMGHANVENIKFNSINQEMTYTLRTSKSSVADMVVKYDELTGSLYMYQKQERESLTGLSAVISGFKAKMKSILQYTASITSIYRVWGTIKQGVNYIREIDGALTELKKVTDETEESYERFVKTAAKTADKVGSTIREVVSSTADWARLGYSLEDAATLAENTSVLLNVSEFRSIEDATSALTSTLQAFGYTANESMNVVDVMNEVGKLVARR